MHHHCHHHHCCHCFPRHQHLYVCYFGIGSEQDLSEDCREEIDMFVRRLLLLFFLFLVYMT